MRSPLARVLAAGVLAVVLFFSGCSTSGSTGAGATSSGTTGSAVASAALFDATRVHTISLAIDEAVLTDVLTSYVNSGDKKWASADVTIDGQQFSNVGIKLKGNSSLRGVSADSDPATLPWRIRLDKYVDGQNLDGPPRPAPLPWNGPAVLGATCSKQAARALRTSLELRMM